MIGFFAENSNKPHGNGIIDPNNFSPFPKNPTIAKFFKEIGWVEELGSGVRNIYKYNKIYSGAEPTFIEGDVFKTVIPLTPQATPQADQQRTQGDGPSVLSKMHVFMPILTRVAIKPVYLAW